MNYLKIIIGIIGIAFISMGPVYAGQKVCFPKACVDVEVADDMPSWTKGLDFRKSLDKNKGMLFVVLPLGPSTFWTKDMLFPLDIIWIGENQKVILVKR